MTITATSRYARQQILPGVGTGGQARLAAAQVLVVGAGGLGSAVLPLLAGAGVGRLRVMDPDVIEESNLHRQVLYRMADLGAPKASVAVREIRALNPGVQAEALTLALSPASVASALQGVDLVIDAADSFAVSYILSDACAARGLPLISASVLGRAGYVAGLCGGAPGWRAVFPDLPARAASCATAGVMGPVVAALGAMQAQMALSVLLGLAPSPLGQMLILDLADWRVTGFRFDSAPEIPGWGFIAPGDLRPGDIAIELRPEDEAPAPALPGALRLHPGALAAWQPPPGARVVLCCRSGLRAWQAATGLAARGHGNIALLAAGS